MSDAEAKYRICLDKNLYYAEEWRKFYQGEEPIGCLQWVRMDDVKPSPDVEVVKASLLDVVMGPEIAVSFDKDMNEIK